MKLYFLAIFACACVAVNVEDDGYLMFENSLCSPYDPSFISTLSEAKRKCNEDPSCQMFNDAKGAGTHFHLCHQGSTIVPSTDSTKLYMKTESADLHSYSLSSKEYKKIIDGKAKTCNNKEKITRVKLGEKNTKYAVEICWLFCKGSDKCKFFFHNEVKNTCVTFKKCKKDKRQTMEQKGSTYERTD